MLERHADRLRLRTVDDKAAACIAACIALLVVLHGGFYPFQACAVGMLASAAALLLSRRAGAGGLAGPLMLAGVGVACLASSLLNGATLSMLAEASRWFALAPIACLASFLARDSARSFVRDALCCIGIACALAGALVFSGVVPLYGVRGGGRLEFPFEYANASGVFFAVCAVSCVCSKARAPRMLACLPMLGLFLTRSVGASTVFSLGMLASVAVLCRRGRHADAALASLSFALAGIAFVGTAQLGGWLAVAFSAAALICALAAGPLVEAAVVRATDRVGAAAHRVSQPLSRWWPLALAACVLVAVLALLSPLLGNRVAQAAQTLAERLIQVQDALFLLARSPLLGIGPDAWSWTYPYAQSAQYQAAVVHSSYVQIALDCGVIGLAAFVAFVAVGFVKLARVRDAVGVIAAAMVVCHAALDFDLRFSAISALLIVFLSPPQLGREAEGRSGGRRRRWAVTALNGACLALCLMGAACAAAIGAAHDAGVSGNVEGVDRVASVGEVASRDVPVRTSRYAALLQAGLYGELAAYEEEVGIGSSEQALLYAAGMFRSGNRAAASNALVTELEREPYNVELFEQAEALFEAYGVDPAAERRYGEARAAASALAVADNASLLGNQKTFP